MYVIAMEGFDDHLHADKGQDEREAFGEINQALKQSLSQELQLAKAHQCKDICTHEDIRIFGNSKDCRD